MLSLGFSNDKAIIQNMSIVLNKLIDTGNVFQMLDEERHKNILEMLVLVIDSWI